MKCTEILILKIRLALPIIAPDEGKSFAVAELQQSPNFVGFSRSFAAEAATARMFNEMIALIVATAIPGDVEVTIIEISETRECFAQRLLARRRRVVSLACGSGRSP